MDPLAYLFLLLVCFDMVFCDGVEGGRWNISVEEDLEFERQLKFLNKPSIKTIRTSSGVIFDCVDFYKQPAFDYARMNNYTIEYEYEMPASNKLKDQLYIGTKGEECPIGSVPIKRITKEDLIREKLVSQERTLVGNALDVYHAIARTKPSINKFVGAGGSTSIWNPAVSGKAYSVGRLKISNQDDSIEVGWRVDPALYGDTHTHLYIRTDAGRSHCFDASCGFVIVRAGIVVGDQFTGTSQHRGPVYDLTIYLIQNTITGNWYLELGSNHTLVGFWPKGLFTGLATLAASAEWGGEVFSLLGTPTPPMGAGSIPKSNVDYDAYFRIMTLLDGQKTLIADNLDIINDTKNYRAIDDGISKLPLWGHMMFYGGSS